MESLNSYYEYWGDENPTDEEDKTAKETKMTATNTEYSYEHANETTCSE